MLRPGTLCWLKNLNGYRGTNFNGRIVSIVTQVFHGDEEWYEVAAPWIQSVLKVLGCSAAHCPRANLQPIHDPDADLTETADRLTSKETEPA